jgi:predicted nucleic acid-binding protein
VSVLLDTGIVYAYYDKSDDWHTRARKLIQSHARGLILPASVIPEADYLLGRTLGPQSRQTFYRGIVEGHYFVADIPRQAYPRIAAIDEQFKDLELGFVDASLVALAESLKVPRIATTDRRHFSAVASAFKFELLP